MVLNTPHGTQDTPTFIMNPPTVLKISPTVLKISPTVLMISPHGTAHTLYKVVLNENGLVANRTCHNQSSEFLSAQDSVRSLNMECGIFPEE